MAVIANLFNVLGAQTGLAVGQASAVGMRFAQQIGNERLHARAGK